MAKKKMSLFIYDYDGKFLTFAQMKDADQNYSFRSFADAIGVTGILIEEAKISMTAKGSSGIVDKDWWSTKDIMTAVDIEEFRFDDYNKDGTMFIRLKKDVSTSVISALKNRGNAL